ncbi:hypothetical protein [[Mycobacterium] burgundiense]|uniref:Uncharacterized protein n=1 Tax=[Mycobacterium] burgundiense TaxID=3064286 RepID=A0ABM9M7E3_9MYCO|nr:hypothetical protein [Mycolicibacterium sp. MU0053]CAJ1511118.1 hypothetical protein MU0053_005035 [Mycolicibacterium sp. MU0053]
MVPDHWPVTACAIEPLTAQQTDELTDALDPTLESAERDDVRVRCDGVPFYVEQIVADMRMATLGQRRVPDTLYEPLIAPLRAGSNMLPVVEAAAIGREVDKSILTAMVDLDESQVDDVLDRLNEAGVLVPAGPDV